MRPNLIGLGEYNERLLEELRRLEVFAAEVESSVCEIASNSTEKIGSDSIKTLQRLDLLRQSLGGISAFVENSKIADDGSAMIDILPAAERILLESMLDRLTKSPKPRARHIDVDLF